MDEIKEETQEQTQEQTELTCREKLIELADELTQSISNLDTIIKSNETLLAQLKTDNSHGLYDGLISAITDTHDKYCNDLIRLQAKQTALNDIIMHIENSADYETCVNELSLIFGLLK